MSEELKNIKKKYGEEMSHLCRTLFPTILDRFPGKLKELLENHFDSNKFLVEDIIDNHLEENFKNYIYSLVDVEKSSEILEGKTPEELLKQAGYILYECKTEEEIQSFKKYFIKDEELCTFKGDRLKRCFVFFAVKKAVDKIKREDFTTPQREDLYGTSVMSIQFTKDSYHTLSIKNRYNHSVNYPDATYSNNLDNIIPGLTLSFAKYYNLGQKQPNIGFSIPNYVMANDGKFYKYNYEINNIYYCENNVIIDNFKVKKYPSESYILADYFIIDLKNKKIKLYDNQVNDCFIDAFSNIKKIDIEKGKLNGKKIIIKQDIDEPIVIELDETNNIIGYKNPNLSNINDSFLSYNTMLTELELPKVTTIENYFLFSNIALTELNLPQVTTIKDCCLQNNKFLLKLNADNLTIIGNNFLPKNILLKNLDLPNLKIVGSFFLNINNSLTKLNLPNLNENGPFFLTFNKSLSKAFIPNNPNLEKELIKRSGGNVR